MGDPALEQRAKSLLDSIARSPRFAGSAEEVEARQICRRELEEAGFSCRDIPFEYSQWPGRWGPPLLAGVQAATILGISRIEFQWGALRAIAFASSIAIVLVTLTARAKRGWIQNLRVQRSTSINLEAVRGAPRIWLCAHLDSKSQTIPMLVRIASAIALGVVTALAVVLLLVQLFAHRQLPSVWSALEIAAVVSALPSVFCWVGNNSRGALDNATGVASVLMATKLPAASKDLGVFISSGEELGLAGARVWAKNGDRNIKLLNCDTVDDNGGYRCMHTGRRPSDLIAAVEKSAADIGLKLATGRLIPGILADSVAFADLDIPAVTLSRGNLSTLARIHTRRDTSNQLTGRGVAEAAHLLAASTRELT
ncbi:MAG TPA: M28 family peptidase [Gemmatimonadaceae bacterium]|nr:M28 family peptidase [Gemmatimonadaceae bacterium]